MKLLSWDAHNINDGTNYDAVLNANFYGLPGVRAVLGSRHGNWPILAGVERPYRQLNFDIYIRSGSSLELAQWFDPEDETAKKLIVEDSDGSNDRFVYAICTEFREVPYSAGLQYAVTVMVDGDVRWREIAITTASAWSVTATGQTKVVANGGQDKAYPILKIEPTDVRSSGGFSYKSFVVVKWNCALAASNYSIDIVNNTFDTATLTTAKMQADGDDLRVYVDGIEVDRWLQDMDTSTTQVWCNLDYEANLELTLDGDINNSVTELNVNESIGILPSSGIIYIGTEVITYTAKNNQEKELSGLTRGAKGSSAATHSDDDDVFWIQHDIWIFYGNSALAAPTVDDNYKPAFLLSSTNISWDYDNFGEDDGLRAASWRFSELEPSASFYGGNQGDDETDPWVEIGINALNGYGRVYIINPCGLTNANFQNGEKRSSDDVASWSAQIEATEDGQSWIYQSAIADPSAEDTWQAWSGNQALTNKIGVGIYARSHSGQTVLWVEAADVTLTLNSSNTPTIVLGSEQGNYTLSCTITNNTTGDAIEINYEMDLNEELEVNTDEKTVLFLDENSNQFNALDLVGGSRKIWLPLDAGNNTLQLDDVGTGDLTITVTWWERYYE